MWKKLNMGCSVGHIHVNLPERQYCRHQGNRHCSKRNDPQMLPWQNWKSLQCYPACCWHFVNRQVKGKILAKWINGHIEHIKYSKSWDSSLKCMKENDQKRKSSKEKGTCVQLKHYLASPQRRISVRINHKEPELLEPVPCEVRP